MRHVTTTTARVGGHTRRGQKASKRAKPGWAYTTFVSHSVVRNITARRLTLCRIVFHTAHTVIPYLQYRAHMSYAPMASPTGCHDTMIRLMASTLLVSLKLSTPGRRAESGTKQRLNSMSAFWTHLGCVRARPDTTRHDTTGSTDGTDRWQDGQDRQNGRTAQTAVSKGGR